MQNEISHDELVKKVRELEERIAAGAASVPDELVVHYHDLVENASDLIHSVTPTGKFLYVNKAWKEVLGYRDEDVERLSLFDIVDVSCREKCEVVFRSLLEGESIDRNETVFVGRDGRKILVEGRCSTRFLDGQPVAMTGIFRDIGERVRNEEALRESEQRYRDLFENAHDLIQILRADGKLLFVNRAWRQAFGYGQEEIDTLCFLDFIAPECRDHCQEMFRRVLADEQVHAISGDIVFRAKDGRRIMVEGNACCRYRNGVPHSTQCIFRDVTEKRRMEEELFKAHKLESIGELVRDCVSFSLRGTNICCRFQISADLWPIEVDEGQLGQVIQNLVINAGQAMPDGGTLTVRLENCAAEEGNALTLAPGPYVRISLADQGVGIPPEYLARIFDPYFSNKPGGSGLGLAIAYSIIKKHAGLITVVSEVGRGSTFTVHLPAATKGSAPVRSVPDPPGKTGGRVLVMDDEEIVREIAMEMLGYLGCETVAARDGEEAIALYLRAREAGRPFDAVLVDLTIAGGMGGRETMELLLAHDPQVRAVVSSGYANDPIMADYRYYGFCGVVPKPYKLHELSETIAPLLRVGSAAMKASG